MYGASVEKLLNYAPFTYKVVGLILSRVFLMPPKPHVKRVSVNALPTTHF